MEFFINEPINILIIYFQLENIFGVRQSYFSLCDLSLRSAAPRDGRTRFRVCQSYQENNLTYLNFLRVCQSYRVDFSSFSEVSDEPGSLLVGARTWYSFNDDQTYAC
jgi:hypothetical protein